MAMTDQQRRQILANEDFWIMLITLKICQEQTLIAPMHDYVRRVNFTNKPRL